MADGVEDAADGLREEDEVGGGDGLSQRRGAVDGAGGERIGNRARRTDAHDGAAEPGLPQGQPERRTDQSGPDNRNVLHEMFSVAPGGGLGGSGENMGRTPRPQAGVGRVKPAPPDEMFSVAPGGGLGGNGEYMGQTPRPQAGVGRLKPAPPDEMFSVAPGRGLGGSGEYMGQTPRPQAGVGRLKPAPRKQAWGFLNASSYGWGDDPQLRHQLGELFRPQGL